MRLISFEAKNLHQTLDINIDFNDELNLIIGINGSGKTSALNCIDWLLSPNLQKLALVKYSYLKLIFEDNYQVYTIYSDRKDKILRIRIFNEKSEEIFVPLTVNLRENEFKTDAELERAYYGLGPETHEKPFWNFLRKLPDILSITLDRSLSAETHEALFYDNPHREPRSSVKRSALDEVKRLTARAHVKYKNNSLKHDDDLKAKIIMAALQGPSSIIEFVQPINRKDTKSLEDKVIKYLKDSTKSLDVETEVRKFFESIIMLSEGHSTRGTDEHFNSLIASQYSRIDKLASAFNEFDNANVKSFRKLKKYLDTVNMFLKDTGKTIDFSPGSSNLVFFMQEKRDGFPTEGKSIEYLSSGEKQILILLTFLAFSSQSKSIFIIDEPEISLHPKWQNEFLDALLNLKPTGMQLIIATHSPEIVGRKKDAVISIRNKRVN